MSTPYQELLDAAHDLLNEIEGSDYEDMIGSSERVNRLKQVSGWPSKVRVYNDPVPTWLNSKPMDGRIMVKDTGVKTPRDYFDIHTYTGDNGAARKNFEETVKVLPPIPYEHPKRELVGLTDDDVEAVIHSAMREITNDSNIYKLSATGVWSALVRAVESKLKEKNT